MTMNPNTAAWDAMQEAMTRKVEPSQASALVAEAVLRAAWDNARALLDGPDVQHTDCIDGACNVCILETFAMALDRRHWSAEVAANSAAVRTVVVTAVPNPDRTVHGRTPNGAEIVRYDRSGKWWSEPETGRRTRIQVLEAAALAAAGEWFEHKPGGEQFDRLVRKLRVESQVTQP